MGTEDSVPASQVSGEGSQFRSSHHLQLACSTSIIREYMVFGDALVGSEQRLNRYFARRPIVPNDFHTLEWALIR